MELSSGSSVSIPLKSFHLVRKGNISKHFIYNCVVFIMISDVFFVLFLVGWNPCKASCALKCLPYTKWVTADRLILHSDSDAYLTGKVRGTLDESNAENEEGNTI